VAGRKDLPGVSRRVQTQEKGKMHEEQTVESEAGTGRRKRQQKNPSVKEGGKLGSPGWKKKLPAAGAFESGGNTTRGGAKEEGSGCGRE